METLKLTSNQYIQIVEAGDEYLVIAISKDEVRLLTKLTEDQLKELPKDGALAEISTESFKEAFEKIKKRIPKK